MKSRTNKKNKENSFIDKNEKFLSLLTAHGIKRTNNKASDINKGRTIYNNIQEWLSQIYQQEDTSLISIQKYMADKGATENEKNIIRTIMSCKNNAEKIQFNTSYFKNPLNIYLYGDNIRTKCLTNDWLNLGMISNAIANKEDKNLDYYATADIEEVRLISDNFILKDDARIGFIQDYDPDFSSLHSEALTPTRIDEVIRTKPNFNSFVYKSFEYDYFGDIDVCFITPKGMPDDQIASRNNKQKYLLHNGSQFQDGHHFINYEKKVCYLDKRVKPEAFCPSYWIATEPIVIKALFKFDLDYNELFGLIEDISNQNNSLTIPDNLCYWDTINQCFDFLSVVALTSQRLSLENKTKIAEWVDEYASMRYQLKELRTNQILLQRIFLDFLESFINNSEYSRFLNLYTKTEKYISFYNDFTKSELFSNFKVFIGKIPFAQMINNQLNGDKLITLVKEMQSVLKDYLSGSKGSDIIVSVRSLAQKIQALLPSKDMTDCAFPFIVPGGQLLGDMFQYNSKEDPLLWHLEKNHEKKQRKEKRQKEDIRRATEIISHADDMLEEFLRAYIPKILNGKKIKEPLDINDLIFDIKKIKNKENKVNMTNYAVKYATNKSLPGINALPEINDVIEDAVRLYKDAKKSKAQKMDIDE